MAQLACSPQLLIFLGLRAVLSVIPGPNPVSGNVTGPDTSLLPGGATWALCWNRKTPGSGMTLLSPISAVY